MGIYLSRGGCVQNPVPLREQPEFDASEFRWGLPLWRSVRGAAIVMCLLLGSVGLVLC